MKNSLYKLGTFSCGLIILSVVFKINHWPGGGIVFTLSISLFSLGYLLPALIKLNRQNSGTGLKWFYVVTTITALLNLLGALWAVMVWPGKTIMVFASILSISILFLPAFLYHFRNDTRTSTTNYFYILFFVVFISVMDALLSIQPSNEIAYDAKETQIELEEFNNRLAKYNTETTYQRPISH